MAWAQQRHCSVVEVIWRLRKVETRHPLVIGPGEQITVATIVCFSARPDWFGCRLKKAPAGRDFGLRPAGLASVV
jgi:hypothetical protein